MYELFFFHTRVDLKKKMYTDSYILITPVVCALVEHTLNPQIIFNHLARYESYLYTVRRHFFF